MEGVSKELRACGVQYEYTKKPSSDSHNRAPFANPRGHRVAKREAVPSRAPNHRLHLTPGSGVRWPGTVSVAPAQVKRGVRRQGRAGTPSQGESSTRRASLWPKRPTTASIQDQGHPRPKASKTTHTRATRGPREPRHLLGRPSATPWGPGEVKRASVLVVRHFEVDG